MGWIKVPSSLIRMVKAWNRVRIKHAPLAPNVIESARHFILEIHLQLTLGVKILITKMHCPLCRVARQTDLAGTRKLETRCKAKFAEKTGLRRGIVIALSRVRLRSVAGKALLSIYSEHSCSYPFAAGLRTYRRIMTVCFT